MRDADGGWPRASSVVLYAAFAMTGFATALLGATLPALAVRWQLTDGRAGFLFLMIFLGSSVGALVSRGRPASSVARGLAITAPACVGLAFAAGWMVFPVAFFYGLGLGIAMTSISLLRSARCTKSRVREMNRLNLIWALGAFACPSLANAALRFRGARTLLTGLGVVFVVFLVWTVLVEVGKMPIIESRGKTLRAGGMRLPVTVALLTLLAIGLESSTGAWIATYAERLRQGFEAPVAAASVFWLGLLAGRALHATKAVTKLHERTLLRADVAIAAAGCCVLALSGGPAMLLVAAGLIGFGVGPVYPLLMAAVLPRIAGNMIFVMAGLGGTVFPLITGAVSARAGSLRVGMLVPTAAGIAMLALVPVVSLQLKRMEGGAG
ncbi:MFS transporter [Granulicella pectinivorans]|uniref:MFS transporter n=1 Tax=Granulicella pectinivorans TaxID=474950 RepID=UPI00113FE2B2|nr:MFS transporter [Granulicella pectinivorans]